ILWALRGDGRQDIFSATEPAGLWSTSGSRACLDDPGALGACVDSVGPFADLWVAASDDAWAVGHHGLVLHYDGSRWRRIVIPTISAPPLNNYDFRGVWGAGEVTFVVGERHTPERWELVIVMYNARLGRWFAPQRLLSLPDAPEVRDATRLFDVGGRGDGEIYCVGGRWEASVARQRAVIFSRVAPSP
ncbi:MAG: hypothetical protein KAI47_13270, partial [Deltaproteobacteria bacterium]|nr:hypothetical protein [Deltaproteobacteria bacterium]